MWHRIGQVPSRYPFLYCPTTIHLVTLTPRISLCRCVHRNRGKLPVIKNNSVLTSYDRDGVIYNPALAGKRYVGVDAVSVLALYSLHCIFNNRTLDKLKCFVDILHLMQEHSKHVPHG